MSEPLETADYVITALGLPDGKGKVRVVGDNISFEMECASYNDAKDQVIRTAQFIDDGEHNAIAWALLFRDRVDELFERHGWGHVIRLTDYETEAELHFLQDNHATTLLYHRIANAECAALLEEEGIAVELHTVRLQDYIDFLAANGLENTPANRGLFSESNR